MTLSPNATAPPTPVEPVPDPVDAVRPLRRTVLFGLQHVLVMAATPISSVFLVSGTLGLDRGLTLNLLATSLVLGQIWFFHYRDVFALDRIVWLVVARDAALAALFAVLAVRLWKTRTPSSEKTSRQRGLRRRRARSVAVANGSQRSA